MKTEFILLTVQIILLMLNTIWFWLHPTFLAGVGFGITIFFVCKSIVRTYQLWIIHKRNLERRQEHERTIERFVEQTREQQERFWREYQERITQERQEQRHREEFQQYQSGTWI